MCCCRYAQCKARAMATNLWYLRTLTLPQESFRQQVGVLMSRSWRLTEARSLNKCDNVSSSSFSLSATMSIDPDLTNFRPGSDAYTELQMLATIFSALACGVVLSLSVSCFQLVWFHKKTNSASKHMHRFLLAYITFMTCTSVVYLALDIASTRNSIFTDGPHIDLFLPGGSRAICVAFASWGADGFMVRILVTIWFLLLPINPTGLETCAALRRSIRTSKSLVHWPSRNPFVFIFR